MKVILLRDVRGLGRKYDEKEVSEGYASNFLIPNKQAVPVNSAAANQIRALHEGESKKLEAISHKLEAEIQRLANTVITLKAKANDKNHLFASLNAEKLSELLKERGFNVPAACIALEAPVKELGSRDIPIEIKGKRTHFTLVVESA